MSKNFHMFIHAYIMLYHPQEGYTGMDPLYGISGQRHRIRAHIYVGRILISYLLALC